MKREFLRRVVWIASVWLLFAVAAEAWMIAFGLPYHPYAFLVDGCRALFCYPLGRWHDLGPAAVRDELRSATATTLNLLVLLLNAGLWALLLAAFHRECTTPTTRIRTFLRQGGTALWHPERGRLWRLTRVFAIAILIGSACVYLRDYIIRSNGHGQFAGERLPMRIAEPLVRWTGVPLEYGDLAASGSATTFARPLVPLLGAVVNAYLLGFLVACVVSFVVCPFRRGLRANLFRFARAAFFVLAVAAACDWLYSQRTADFYRRHTWWCWDLSAEEREEGLAWLLRPWDSEAARELAKTWRPDSVAAAQADDPLARLEHSSCRWVIYDYYREAPYYLRYMAAVSIARMEGRAAVPRFAAEIVDLRCIWRMPEGPLHSMGRLQAEEIVYRLTGIRDEWSWCEQQLHRLRAPHRFVSAWILGTAPDREYLRRLDLWLQEEGFGPLRISREQAAILEPSYPLDWTDDLMGREVHSYRVSYRLRIFEDRNYEPPY